MPATRLKDDIGACVFDAYGTLFDVAAAAVRCQDALGDQVQPLAAVWRTKQLEYTWLRSLMGEFADFWHVTGQALDYAMETLDLDDAALRTRLMELYLRLDTFPEVRDTLATLTGAGVKTAVLSNASVTMLTAAVKSAELEDLLDAVISVDPLRIYKPHPSVYQLAVDTLILPPERICFMSSNAWDAAGAAHFGFRVVWVNRYGQKAERLPGTPEFEITSLADLPALLGV